MMYEFKKNDLENYEFYKTEAIEWIVILIFIIIVTIYWYINDNLLCIFLYYFDFDILINEIYLIWCMDKTRGVK